MDYHDSDLSDDDQHPLPASQSRKRSSRACDQCRKTKSKCERSTPDAFQCKSCALTGTACTFLGPSYKRGPPKGYIHAIEQRWHQVESLLGAIMQCPDTRVQSIVSDLRQDNMAREILSRVDLGPYGPSGRRIQPVSATKEDFFASVLRSNESSQSRDPSRSRRQSRMSREKVSATEGGSLSFVPTPEWQDDLSRRLTGSNSPPTGISPSAYGLDLTGMPVAQRRRLNDCPPAVPGPPNWSNLYTIDAEGDNPDDLVQATEKFGELSLDEFSEIRFHGEVSGLHLLRRNDRTDNRMEGGVWNMPMARVWPPSHSSKRAVTSDEDMDIPLPPVPVQERLVDVYFTYIHPTFPVVHKERFLTEFKAKIRGSDASTPSSTSSSSPHPEPCQRVSSLLLLSMFSIAARFRDEEMPFPPSGKMWEAGYSYLDGAKTILTRIFDRSRPSTVQALLILGYREFGIGSVEQAWMYIGMAIRMAIDLGLNCDSTTWKRNGRDLFSKEEIQIRRQVWWACCLADRYGSIYMGRPIIIREDDFDTLLPDHPEEDEQTWQPLPDDTISVSYPPVRCRTFTCFNAAAGLTIILGGIISKIYPVRGTGSRRTLHSSIESQLDQWYLNLDDDLRYEPASRHYPPPPHILFLHIRYWGAVLLLNRAMIPNWKGLDTTSTQELRAFDLAQSAANHVSAIVATWQDTFTLKRASPFLTSYIFSAGIMHILTLTLRSTHVEATLGLRQCMSALKDMEVVWPSAQRAGDLLKGVRLGFDRSQPVEQNSHTDRYKRQADDAFGQDKTSDYLQQDAFTANQPRQLANNTSMDSGVQDLGTRIMAQMLGLDVPGFEPSTSFYPGYDYWPRQNMNPVQSLPPINVLPTPADSTLGSPESMSFVRKTNSGQWVPPTDPLSSYNFNYGNSFKM